MAVLAEIIELLGLTKIYRHEQNSDWLERFGQKTSISYLKELEDKIIDLIGGKTYEALELGMIPAEIAVEDKNGKWYYIPFMEPKDVIMWRDPNGILWVSRNFKGLDSNDFNIVNLTNTERALLREQFTCEYENGPSFSKRDSCAYATDRMIGFQKMIDTLFCEQPIDTILSVETISDLKMRGILCDLYNTRIDIHANVLKVAPNEFDAID